MLSPAPRRWSTEEPLNQDGDWRGTDTGHVDRVHPAAQHELNAVMNRKPVSRRN